MSSIRGFMVPTEYDRRYLGIAMPAAAEGIFMILLSNVDIIMVGTLGTTAIAAVSIFTQPRMVILTLARSLATALTLLAAEHYGRKEEGVVGTLLKQSVVFWGAVLILLHLVFFWNLDYILIWMGAESTYLSLALEYADIALAAVFITSITAILQAVMLGFGKTGAVLKINLIGNVVNVIANALLIFGIGPFPAMGVQGAAIGTVLGASYSIAATVIYLHGHGLLEGSTMPSMSYLRQFMPVFGGVFSEQGCERIGMVLYTRMAAELGTIPYAVHAICMNFCDFYYSFAGGLGKASMVLAGQSRGSGNIADWHGYLKVGIKWGLIFSAASFLLTFVFREEIFSVYSADPNASALGSLILIFVAAVSFPEAHAMICAGVLRGSGKTNQVAIYSFISITIMRPIITAFFLYYLSMGLPGAWLALAIDQSTRAVCAHWLMKRIRMT